MGLAGLKEADLVRHRAATPSPSPVLNAGRATLGTQVARGTGRRTLLGHLRRKVACLGAISLTLMYRLAVALDSAIAGMIDDYARGDLPPREWFTDYFDFIRDPPLRERLSDEFYTTRYVYKILEGLAVQRELQVAQVRLQVLQYASIYEAILHHLLFDVLKAEPQVQQMLSFQSLKKYSVPPAMRETLAGLVHDGHRIVPAYYSESQVSPSKVRFDDKARCVCDLGLIDGAMRNDLISIYEARNAIHLHAELRKGISWELELSRTAYRRHKPLREQIVRGLRRFSR